MPHKQIGHDKEDVEASRHHQPQRNRLLIKDNKATAVDDTSTLDSDTRQNVPIVEDDGDRMLEIIEEEYLEQQEGSFSFVYNDDDDDEYVAIDGPTVGGYDEVSEGPLTFTTATDIITTTPSRPPSGVWDDIISTDATLPWATSTEQPLEDVVLTTTDATSSENPNPNSIKVRVLSCPKVYLPNHQKPRAHITRLILTMQRQRRLHLMMKQE